MRIILRSDRKGLGKRGDIVEVSDGHARNFLLPHGHALMASDGAVAQAASMRRSRDLRDAQDREGAQTIASALVPRVITIAAKSGPEGKLYGSVTWPMSLLSRGATRSLTARTPQDPISHLALIGDCQAAQRRRVPDHGRSRQQVILSSHISLSTGCPQPRRAYFQAVFGVVPFWHRPQLSTRATQPTHRHAGA